MVLSVFLRRVRAANVRRVLVNVRSSRFWPKIIVEIESFDYIYSTIRNDDDDVSFGETGRIRVRSFEGRLDPPPTDCWTYVGQYEWCRGIHRVVEPIVLFFNDFSGKIHTRAHPIIIDDIRCTIIFVVQHKKHRHGRVKPAASSATRMPRKSRVARARYLPCYRQSKLPCFIELFSSFITFRIDTDPGSYSRFVFDARRYSKKILFLRSIPNAFNRQSGISNGTVNSAFKIFSTVGLKFKTIAWYFTRLNVYGSPLRAVFFMDT